MPTRARRTKNGQPTTSHSATLDENLEAIKKWERGILVARSKAEQVTDWIVAAAGHSTVLIFHFAWFGMWIMVNSGVFKAIPVFDPFPFPFLTLTVSLEAIFLALFVLASQNRLARQSDMRSHLDLQIDLLAEREMTAVLQLLQDITKKLDVDSSVTPAQLRDLMQKTDLGQLTDRMEELAEPDEKGA